MINLNEEIVSLDNILNIVKNDKESYIRINYCIEGKIIPYDIDYSDVKDDPNEEKTKLEKDYEKINKVLTSDFDSVYVLTSTLHDINEVLNSKEKNKLTLIKELMKNVKF